MVRRSTQAMSTVVQFASLNASHVAERSWSVPVSTIVGEIGDSEFLCGFDHGGNSGSCAVLDTGRLKRRSAFRGEGMTPLGVRCDIQVLDTRTEGAGEQIVDDLVLGLTDCSEVDITRTSPTMVLRRISRAAGRGRRASSNGTSTSQCPRVFVKVAEEVLEQKFLEVSLSQLCRTQSCAGQMHGRRWLCAQAQVACEGAWPRSSESNIAVLSVRGKRL